MPNPKLWRERIANTPAPPISSEETSSAERSSKPQKESADDKRAKADAAESQHRLISFQKGAADMASTASYMLKLVESNTAIAIADHNDIISATGNFKNAVLTPKEVAWYRSIETANKIAIATELRVLTEGRKQWKLLNIPEQTPAQKQREQERNESLKQRAIQVEKALRGLAVRDGEGEYDPDRQVIAFDGFEPAQTQDLDRMTRPNLEALAKGHIKSGDMKKMNVKELRNEVKKLVDKHPNMLQIPVARATPPTETASAAPMAAINTDTATASLNTLGSNLSGIASASTISNLGTLIVSSQCCSVVEVQFYVNKRNNYNSNNYYHYHSSANSVRMSGVRLVSFHFVQTCTVHILVTAGRCFVVIGMHEG